MRNNPYPNDPINTQMTDIIPPLPDLPTKMPVQQAPQPIPESSGRSEDVEGEKIQQEPASQTIELVLGKANDFLQWLAIVVELTLGLRFFFKLIGASPNNIFASFIYALTNVLLLPFNNLINNPSLHSNQAFEWTTLIAMGIYAVIFWLLRKLIHISYTPPKPEE
ncbi:MAG TPA: hypothetical protein VEL69_04975 [Ktedonobacteraceae bacterium]|nr:hypothetical protein [Ktedonobacteraceae bacterium]